MILRVLALPLLLLPLVSSSAAGNSASAAPEKEWSARFYESTSYLIEGEQQLDVLEGAFDWRKQEGWAERRYANETLEWRYVHGTCFARFLDEPWQQEKGVCGIAEMVNDPAKTFRLIKELAGLERVGEEVIDGVRTTRYRATWDEAGQGPLELWADDDEIVRRIKYGGPESTTSIDYVDFGVVVDVEAPVVVKPESAPIRKDSKK